MLTQEEIASLKAKHKDILVVRHSKQKDLVAVVRMPDADEYQMYRDASYDSDRKSSAMVELVNQCLVWPEGSEKVAMFNRRPGFYETVGNKLVDEAGAEQNAVVEKP